LRSLVCEAAEGVEVLVIDSSPTSTARDIARVIRIGYAYGYSSVATFARGQAKTNFAVEMAESSHICWLGVDDLWLPGRARAVRAWVEAAPDAPLHLAPSEIIDKGGRRLGVWRCPLPADVETPIFSGDGATTRTKFLARPQQYSAGTHGEAAGVG